MAQEENVRRIQNDKIQKKLIKYKKTLQFWYIFVVFRCRIVKIRIYIMRIFRYYIVSYILVREHIKYMLSLIGLR